MLESEKLRRGIERTQKEWEAMSLKKKREKILDYWERKLESETDQQRINFIYNHILMTEELDEPEISDYLGKVHGAIMDNARKLEKEAQEREGDSNR